MSPSPHPTPPAPVELSLGLPSAPLPDRWWGGLTRKQIRQVVRVEVTGNPRVMPTPHPRGYIYVYLGRGHPYASSRSGTCALHRWLIQRAQGVRLPSSSHVHHSHANGGARQTEKWTTDHTRLEVLEAIDHGQYHYGTHFVRGARGRLVWVGAGERYTEEELERMAERHDDSGDTPDH